MERWTLKQVQDDRGSQTESDPAQHLETEDDILHFPEAAMEGNDPKHIASALGDVARSKGMSEIAKQSGLGRQALYNTLSENGNQTLETLTAVL